MTIRLFLVRHGETAANNQMRYIGSQDEPLTGNGLRQANQVAVALAQFAIKVVYSSPLCRAADTAAEINKVCGFEVRLDARLAEGSFGSWEGLSRSEVMNLSIQDAELLARWESDPSFAPPGGESMAEVQERMLSLIQELEYTLPGAEVVLVSHVGPVKAAVAATLGIPLQSSRRLFLDPATISVVDWGTAPLLRLFNSHAHLGWSSARWMTDPKPV